MGTYAKIAAYSGLLCTVCRKSAYFAKIFARLRKLYYISPRKDETTTTKNKNTMKKQITLKDLANYYATDRDGARFKMRGRRYEFVTIAPTFHALTVQTIVVLYDFRAQQYIALDLRNDKRAAYRIELER